VDRGNLTDAQREQTHRKYPVESPSNKEARKKTQRRRKKDPTFPTEGIVGNARIPKTSEGQGFSGGGFRKNAETEIKRRDLWTKRLK